MSIDAFRNFATSALTGSLTNVATTFTVLTSDGARFPAVPFNATLWDSTSYASPDLDPNVEVVRVTAVSGDVFTTIVRAQEGTAAVAHGNTVKVLAGLTAKTLNVDLSRPLVTLVSQTALTNPQNYTTPLATYTIPAAFLRVNDFLRLTAMVKQVAGTGTIGPRFQLAFGAQNWIAETTIGVVAETSFMLVANLWVTGASTEVGHGFSGRMHSANNGLSTFAESSLTVASSGAIAVALGGRYNGANGTASLQCVAFTLELIRA